MTFAAEGGGTRITVTHAGFGQPSILGSPGVQHGMDEALDDLILYLEHSVVFPRHRDYGGRGDLGVQVRKVPGAVEVTEVRPGGLGDQVGMRPGDLLLRLGERGVVFDLDDLAFFLRSHEVGDEVEVGYAHDGELRAGRGTLPAADFDFARTT
jgi:predicted metalloprotease with PDZ domain